MAVRAQKKRKRKKPTFPALQWLTDATGLRFRVTLLGSHCAMVENHLGILEFTDSVIRLKTRNGVLTFLGSELVLAEVRPGALSIRGGIGRIVLPGGEEGADA